MYYPEFIFSDVKSSLDLAEYVRSNLYQHLCAATEIFLSGQNIPGDHPAVSILDDLDRTTYYHLDANQSHCISYLAQYTIRSVVRWADMLNGHLKVGALCILWFHFQKEIARARLSWSLASI